MTMKVFAVTEISSQALRIPGAGPKDVADGGCNQV